MSPTGTSVVCQRVRAQVSLRLDDELSQLELRMLDAHLESCAPCSAYAADVTEFTHQLRSAPLETLDRPIAVKRPRRLALARLQVGVAAMLAIATVGVATQVTQSGQRDTSFSGNAVTRFPTRAELDRELAILESQRLPARTTVPLSANLL